MSNFFPKTIINLRKSNHNKIFMVTVSEWLNRKNLIFKSIKFFQCLLFRGELVWRSREFVKKSVVKLVEKGKSDIWLADLNSANPWLIMTAIKSPSKVGCSPLYNKTPS